MTHDSFEFHRDEYGSLRDEILAHQAARSRLESLGIAGILGVYAWLATNPVPGPFVILKVLGWWLPFGAAWYVSQRIAGLSAGIRAAGGYLAELERRYADETLGGWHAMRSMVSDDEKRKISTPMGVLWKWLVAGTAAIAVFATFVTIAIQR